ncbi:heat-shock protein Hsp70 [Bacillus canaveralius]|uniref:Chaperone protein DnaK n=1 Tax=Bacillus canaveralius TaxID=1403243 RepID=A0A2N5GQT3_9BACI|nr:Hsp70 family protein [Bacillus canaveralius]PLR85590.1 heat-shock protein Hsp70 [Bacillus canaveralius]PLR94749.1 heat-shock protein Hsp70 [Bacillus canaveralius]
MPNHENVHFRPIVGIDLGTTNSAVAHIHNGKPEMILSPKGERIIPSVVLIDLKNNVIVGEDARSALVAMPDRSVSAIKRKMGLNEPVSIAGQALLPQEVSALILQELKSYVDAIYGEGEKEAVITVPAYFTDEQRRATKQAGELAGFVVERIINEPTAAALAFGLEHTDEDRLFLVYDLGGGTFDVSVVEMMSGLLEVRASTGNHRLGGEDFDWKLVDFLSEKIVEESDIDPRNDIRATALLKEEAEKIKMRLSKDFVVPVELPLVTVKDNEPVGISTEITREQFVGLIDGLLLETMESVSSVLKDAQISPADIEEVLLVGGSTRIPRVRELIQDMFAKSPRTDVNPDEAVALGAAVQAGLKSGALSDSGLVATDVAPFSMGISVLKEWMGLTKRPGGFAPIIPRNTTIPVTRTEKLGTSAPGQTEVAIEIFQGEHEWVKYNHRLGEFLLSGIPANFDKQEEIDVTFRYNLNGILEVSAKCVSTGKEMSVIVQDGLQRDSQKAFQESVQRLEDLWKNADQDLDDEELIDADWEEMEDLLDDTELDEFDIDNEQAPSVLHEEAVQLRERAVKMMAELDADGQSKARQVINSLDQAIAGDDLEHLRNVIDEATDALIDLEL